MKVSFKNSFLKAISKIPNKQLKINIAEVIEGTEKAESLNQIKNLIKLKGYSDYFRIRLGQYRIGLKLKNDILFFVAFAHRKDIYKTFP